MDSMSLMSGVKLRMSWVRKACCAILLFFWLVPGWAGDSLTIIYSGNLDGELEPCGCSSEGDFGGIKRRATLLEQLRKEIPSLIVVSAGGLLSAAGPGDRLKGEYILKGFAVLDYDAIGVQWRDLAYGPEFASFAPLPWVISNWQGEATLAKAFPKQRVIVRGKQKIAYFSWLDPKKSPLREMQGGHSLASKSSAELKHALQKAKQAGQLTLLATTLTSEQMASVVNFKDVDILIERAAYEEYGEPRLEGGALVVTPGSRGMRLGPP